MCRGGTERKADELHFLLAAAQGSSARSPINRLKDEDVRKKKKTKKNERPLALWRGHGRGRAEGGERNKGGRGDSVRKKAKISK